MGALCILSPENLRFSHPCWGVLKKPRVGVKRSTRSSGEEDNISPGGGAATNFLGEKGVLKQILWPGGVYLPLLSLKGGVSNNLCCSSQGERDSSLFVEKTPFLERELSSLQSDLPRFSAEGGGGPPHFMNHPGGAS